LLSRDPRDPAEPAHPEDRAECPADLAVSLEESGLYVAICSYRLLISGGPVGAGTECSVIEPWAGCAGAEVVPAKSQPGCPCLVPEPEGGWKRRYGWMAMIGSEKADPSFSMKF
jgi:hypothetical protein